MVLFPKPVPVYFYNSVLVAVGGSGFLGRARITGSMGSAWVGTCLPEHQDCPAALNVSEDQGSLPQGFFLRSRCPTPRGWKTWREGALEAAVGRARLSPTCTMLAIGF